MPSTALRCCWHSDVRQRLTACVLVSQKPLSCTWILQQMLCVCVTV
jgi:hypothetical protein